MTSVPSSRWSKGEEMEQQDVINIISQFTGQSNLLVIPRVLIDFTGSIKSALFLSQLLYWTGKTRDGWVYKTYQDWENEISIKEDTLRAIINEFKKLGILETRVAKANGNPTVHYHLIPDKLTEELNEFLKEQEIETREESNTSGMKPEKIHGTIPEKFGVPLTLNYNIKLTNSGVKSTPLCLEEKLKPFTAKQRDFIQEVLQYWKWTVPIDPSEINYWRRGINRFFNICDDISWRDVLRRIHWKWDKAGQQITLASPNSLLKLAQAAVSELRQEQQGE